MLSALTFAQLLFESCLLLTVATVSHASLACRAAVQSELRDWLQHPPDGCKLVQYEDLRTWVIELLGPESPCQPQLYTGEQ